MPVSVLLTYASSRGSTEEVAQVIVLLAHNGYITGQTININGGWYMS